MFNGRHVPPAAFYSGQRLFRVLGSTPRIVFASLTAYLISSLIDAEIFFLESPCSTAQVDRVLVSNAISTWVDSVIFITLAFYGTMPVWILIKGQYVIKMAITLLSLPLIYLVKSSGKFGATSSSLVGMPFTGKPGRPI
jgi:uncharacterized integral membrane protein (TIGR00697 family)